MGKPGSSAWEAVYLHLIERVQSGRSNCHHARGGVRVSVQGGGGARAMVVWWGIAQERLRRGLLEDVH